ncbi:hypothetical protein U27_03947 [Candidatus Vecturithrix granuli]|uniref:Tagaturonate/fructuronate epimerase n=1 Tax=Vecturithrix granuli TaxID=1499967 RepID=A0A081BXC8_VECG1|nr:hypothetical protein U27_03947 [Candidatus Vecturithrix granuli]
MQQSIRYLLDQNMLTADLEQYTIQEGKVEHGIYLSSLQRKGAALFCLCRDEERRVKYVLMLSASADAFPTFPGQRMREGEFMVATSDLTPKLAVFLRKEFPYTAPQSLRDKNATFGTGDRLGNANPAHVRAVRSFNIFPVLAQQSIRELNFTRRTFQDVVDAATFAVFQEGYTGGYGADGDHLKNIPEIKKSLESGATMITLDLSEVMNATAANWSAAQILQSYQQFPKNEVVRLEKTYLNSTFTLQNGLALTFSTLELQRCCVMYSKALRFAKEAYDLLVEVRGAGNFDFEMSIDETETPTLPLHHVFIICELIHHGVKVDSLAPRFIGEFQKGIDYLGDLKEFEAQFQIHSQIAKTYGNYKLSIHSGSDKFSVYPTIGKWTEGHVHVKTAGTSWLEAVRVIAMYEPALYREIHTQALNSYQDALKYYHITADLDKVAPLDKTRDADLPRYLEQPDSRQLLHISYGYVMGDKALRARLYDALFVHEDAYLQRIRDHIRKHVRLLGCQER